MFANSYIVTRGFSSQSVEVKSLIDSNLQNSFEKVFRITLLIITSTAKRENNTPSSPFWSKVKLKLTHHHLGQKPWRPPSHLQNFHSPSFSSSSSPDYSDYSRVLKYCKQFNMNLLFYYFNISWWNSWIVDTVNANWNVTADFTNDFVWGHLLFKEMRSQSYNAQGSRGQKKKWR